MAFDAVFALSVAFAENGYFPYTVEAPKSDRKRNFSTFPVGEPLEVAPRFSRRHQALGQAPSSISADRTRLAIGSPSPSLRLARAGAASIRRDWCKQMNEPTMTGVQADRSVPASGQGVRSRGLDSEIGHKFPICFGAVSKNPNSLKNLVAQPENCIEGRLVRSRGLDPRSGSWVPTRRLTQTLDPMDRTRGMELARGLMVCAGVATLRLVPLARSRDSVFRSKHQGWTQALTLWAGRNA